MFNIPSHVLSDQYRLSSSNNQHHAYVVRVKAPSGGIQSKVFASNQNTLRINGAPYCWRELTNITRIDINDTVSYGLLRHTTGHFTMKDVYGNIIRIHIRDAEFIRNMILKSFHMTSPVYNLRYIHSYRSSSHFFLNGTQCYTM